MYIVTVKIIGVINVYSLMPWKRGEYFSEITSYILIVQRKVTGEINVRVEGVIYANQNTIVVCVRNLKM